MWIFNTNKGYIKLKPDTIEFTAEKDIASQFTGVEINLFSDSIIDAAKDIHGCTVVDVERFQFK